MEKIVENALGSIRIGLEDFELAKGNDDDARYTSAVRNVFAGILLLAKSKLYELSPAGSDGILIRVTKPVLSNGRLELQPVGRKTIDYDEIRHRFKHFGLALDWTRIDRIREIRNDLEHYFHAGSRATIRQALAESAVTIRALLRLLGVDPVRDLGAKWWDILLANETVFAAELAQCGDSLRQVKWINESAKVAAQHLVCPECHSSLVGQQDPQETAQEDIVFVCHACGAEPDREDVMEIAIQDTDLGYSYEAALDGADPPVVWCPQCRRDAYVLSQGECAVCGFEMPSDATCGVCHQALSTEEWDEHGGLCYYHANLLAKDD